MSEFKWEISQVEKIVNEFSAMKINGVLVDVQSANRMVQVFKKLNAQNQVKAQSVPIERFNKFVWSF